MKLTLIDPALQGGGSRYVPALAGTGVSEVVEFGHQVEVPDHIAGREPSENSLGHGLLAQTDVWARSDKPNEGE